MLRSVRLSRVRALAALALAAACGSGSEGVTTPPSSLPVTPATPVATSIVATGGGQIARIGQAVIAPMTVAVRDQASKPMAGVLVSFSLTGGGGTLAAPSATTDATGSAAVPVWTLGTAPGLNTLVATANGSAGPSAQITATARPPRWTVLVYMAADNNLSVSGLGDIEEMEAAGANPEVQVVLQAEFSPTVFAENGATAASAHLQNFNTFRYAFGGLTPLATNVFGPNGAVADIGNRNMTSPAELQAFLQWGRSTYPAEHYALVLWNHGGGYQGLLSDETSAPGSLMSLPQLKSALAGQGPLDLIDFDMCLMGGYETLEAVNGVAKVAAFSEDVEPGDGDPYTTILQALYQSPSMDGRALASSIVDSYNAYYVKSGRSSVTKSAYDLSGFGSFDSAVNALASNLKANVGAWAAGIAANARASQKYTVPMFTDVADVVDSLGAHTSDAALRAQLTAVKATATASGFRINNKVFTSASYGAASVGRSTGLSIVLPGGGSASDWFASNAHPLGLPAYQAAMPNKPWTQFLTSYAATLTAPAANYADLGTKRWEVYLVWDTASVSRNVDVDLWVLEPNGNLFIPYLGTVTSNGALTGDSYTQRTYFEGYMMNRYVQTGRYTFYASLWADPQNHQPVFDVAYRQGATASLVSLYAPNFPRLSNRISWTADPGVTFAKINAGSYTDIRAAAVLDIGSTAGQSASIGASDAGVSEIPTAIPSRTGEVSQTVDVLPMMSALHSADARRITAAQLARVQREWPTMMARRRADFTLNLPGAAVPALPSSLLRDLTAPRRDVP